MVATPVAVPVWEQVQLAQAGDLSVTPSAHNPPPPSSHLYVQVVDALRLDLRPLVAPAWGAAWCGL